MFFDEDSLSVRLLDVVALDSGRSDTLNRRGYHALSFRLEGDTKISFHDRTVHVGGGSVGYFPANLSYRRQAERDRMIVVHFDTEQYFSSAIEFVQPSDPALLQPLFERALDCWQKKEAGYYYRTLSCFYEILALLRAERSRREAPDLPKALRPALQYLDAHFTNPELSIEELAEAAHISAVYFRKLFKEATGLSPRRYLIEKRISYAVSLLESGYLSVKQAAEQAGFSDPKYFSTVFRETVGCSPSRYLYRWENEEKVE
ncbi:MAG: helix-turn-helix transcriptional regulator [Clostridia bacterium]|nr:helix-turn-helix transcriptional regulator [Clostridia bacterium]